MTGQEYNQKLFRCPALAALRVISGKWKTRILWLLRERPYYFGELKRSLHGVSAKVLAEQIHQLEAAGVILSKEDFRDGVKHVSYEYSEYGETLIPALDALGKWGLIHDAKMET